MYAHSARPSPPFGHRGVAFARRQQQDGAPAWLAPSVLPGSAAGLPTNVLRTGSSTSTTTREIRPRIVPSLRCRYTHYSKRTTPPTIPDPFTVELYLSGSSGKSLSCHFASLLGRVSTIHGRRRANCRKKRDSESDDDLPDGPLRYFVDSGNEAARQHEGVAKPPGGHRTQAFLSPRQTACQQRRLPSRQRVHVHLSTSNTIISGVNKVPLVYVRVEESLQIVGSGSL